MLVKLENPAQLSKVIDILAELVTEVRIKINDSGMSIVAIDPANVTMVGFRLPKRAFSQFETSDEVLGVNLDDLKKILKRSGTKSSIILEKQENLLNIQIYDRIKRTFKLNLIEISSEDKELPNLDFSSKVEMNSSDLVDSIEDCTVVADACSFIIEEGKFIIEAKGINSARSEFSGDEAEINAEDCKARYSLEYLSKFIKGAKIADRVVMNFANEHPLRMDFRTEGMELSFVLAPRVETED
ncbi:proliferating cell nuclear antigen (pcna) [Candidatus Pacearchaeota archaeon]|jgi:proliferating cell nuclear antigen|nr:proliferating cell nuclear antigen (pcna) [Candidatus Pacearchaeota archaeon]|tara:strand:+ start:666 stop:1391 length:726 start_codon:yes stop_codon:yes gene_type:complete